MAKCFVIKDNAKYFLGFLTLKMGGRCEISKFFKKSLSCIHMSGKLMRFYEKCFSMGQKMCSQPHCDGQLTYHVIKRGKIFVTHLHSLIYFIVVTTMKANL